MAACIAVLWPIVRPYQWVNGDAQLYALQALAHAYPDRYVNDLYFLFGSQDRYTLLTNLAAPVYAALGADHATAALTLILSGLWALACFALAAATVGRKLAWLSLACAVVTTGAYGGGGDVFRYAEGYFSARLPAEVMILAALALQLLGRTAWSILLMTCAALTHPIMTIPALGLAVLIAIPARKWPAALAAALLGCGLLLGLAFASPIGPLSIVDPTWLSTIERRSSFLFPSDWTSADWGRAGVMMGSLLVAGRILRGTTAGRLAHGSLAIAALGLLIAYVGSDVLPVAFVLQVQPWRAMWLATLIAAILLPAALAGAWHGRPLERSAALLVCAAILDVESSASLPATVAAVAAACWPREPAAVVGRLIVGTASVVLLACLALNALAVVDALQLPLFGTPDERSLEILRNVGRFASIPAALTLTVWVLCVRRPSIAGIAVASVAVVALSLGTLGPAFSQAGQQTYSGPIHASFAGWRAIIPRGATVLWLENPSAVWFLLERPNFVSIHQLAGVVFSRELALEAVDRIRAIRPVADPSAVFGDLPKERRKLPALSTESLARVCLDPRLDYLVSSDSLPGAVARLNWPDASRFIYLYDCDASHRSAHPTG